ncbi:hypothetical protein FRC02_011340 [Tulasnella sp. 418]|nr:hypothetical protein FRC02_011340 [Tulasnella sp. 418]
MSAASIILPSTVRRTTSNRYDLGPISLVVSFTGSLPARLSAQHVPLTISVSIPEDVAGDLTPVIQLMPTLPPKDLLLTNTPYYLSEPQHSVPFLPLSKGFDPSNHACWSKLAGGIQDWLVNDVCDRESQQWTWGVEAFWISFIAAHPAFPVGSWPTWDCRIPLRGQFIESWLSEERLDDDDDDDDDDEDDDEDMGSNEEDPESPGHRDVHELMWSKFCQLITYNLPHVPIIQ